ncbi:MAG: hypothetical protein WC676_05340 [Candidatus Omnitrophota bacterium]
MRIIFAIHGIQSVQKDNWVNKFVNYINEDERFDGDIKIPHTYGYLRALNSVNMKTKFDHVKSVMRELRSLTTQYPDAELNIVGHSYGTELSYQAIKRSEEDGKSPIKVNKLILVASIVSAHREIPYDDTLRAGKLNELHCYCSYNDEVCRYNPFGHSGCFGFLRSAYDMKCYQKPFKDLEIYNHQQKTLEHGDYFEGTKFYKEWLDVIDLRK